MKVLQELLLRLAVAWDEVSLRWWYELQTRWTYWRHSGVRGMVRAGHGWKHDTGGRMAML
jgi:hypothetical protein